MRRVDLVLAALMTLFLSGCVLRGKQPQQKATVAPPPPKPIQAPPPASAPGPLSIPQTHAELPAPQPINPDALATATQPEGPPDNQPTPRIPRRAPGPVAGPPKPPDTPPVQAQTPPPAPATAEPERPRVQEIVPAAELKRLQEAAQARKREIRKALEEAQAHRLSSPQRALVPRIQSFLQLSDDAEVRGDMRQADALAERAQVLARELQGVR